MAETPSAGSETHSRQPTTRGSFGLVRSFRLIVLEAGAPFAGIGNLLLRRTAVRTAILHKDTALFAAGGILHLNVPGHRAAGKTGAALGAAAWGGAGIRTCSGWRVAALAPSHATPRNGESDCEAPAACGVFRPMNARTVAIVAIPLAVSARIGCRVVVGGKGAQISYGQFVIDDLISTVSEHAKMAHWAEAIQRHVVQGVPLGGECRCVRLMTRKRTVSAPYQAVGRNAWLMKLAAPCSVLKSEQKITLLQMVIGVQAAHRQGEVAQPTRRVW